MINLKQFIKLIPYYQDYSVWYGDVNKKNIKDYKCVYRCCDSIFEDDDYEIDYIIFMKKYGKCPVKHVLAGRAEELHIYLKEGSLDT